MQENAKGKQYKVKTSIDKINDKINQNKVLK